jgi:O-antigen ligase
MLFAWSIYMLWERGLPKLPRGIWGLVIAMAIYAFLHIADAWFRGEGIRGFDQPSRFLFAIPCLIALFHMQPRWSWAWSGIALGAMSAGVLAYYQRFHEGISRVHGYMGPEHFGNQSTLLCLLSFVALFWGAAVARSRLLIMLSVLGIVGGGLGAVLSGTRAAWLSVIFIVPVLLLIALRLRLYRAVSAVSLGVVILMGLLFSSPELGVQQRVMTAADEVVAYFAGDVRGSAGLRLELWRTAQIMFSEKPFLGYGEAAYTDRIKALSSEGVVNHQVFRFNHIHNDWMNALAKGGMLGFLVLLGIYLIPVTLSVMTALRFSDISHVLLAVGCIALVGNFVIYGQMHNALGANNGVMTYAFWMVLFVAAFTFKDSEGMRPVAAATS